MVVGAVEKVRGGINRLQGGVLPAQGERRFSGDAGHERHGEEARVRLVPPDQLDRTVEGWLDAICASAPEAVRSQKALITRWEQTTLEDGILAGIDALASAYETGEPRERIAAFFEQRARLKRQ